MARKESTQVQPDFERKITEREFPVVPEDRMNSLLSSVNIGPKSTTLLLLPQSGYVSRSDLYNRFREIYKGTPVGDFSSSSASNYCRDSLVPVGLVAQEYVIDHFGTEKNVGFGLTPTGYTYGVPAASLALQFEGQNKFSLYPVFGQIRKTSPEGDRSPYIRAKILVYLSGKQGENVRVTDIVQDLGIPETTVSAAVGQLKVAGVIEKDSIRKESGKREVTYYPASLDLTSLEPVGNNVTLTEVISRICIDLSNRGIPITQLNVFNALPEEQKSRRKEIHSHRLTTLVLSGLARQGFLERGQFKGGEMVSSLAINDIGTIIVTDFINPLNALAHDDPEAIAWFYNHVIPDVGKNFEHYSVVSGEAYYPYSKSFKTKSADNDKAVIRELIKASEAGINGIEIAGQMGGNLHTVRAYLKEMYQSGDVVREQRDGMNYYKFVDTRE